MLLLLSWLSRTSSRGAAHLPEVVRADSDRVEEDSGDILTMEGRPLRLGIVDGRRVVSRDDVLQLCERREVRLVVGCVLRGREKLVDLIVLVKARVRALRPPLGTCDLRVAVIPGVVVIRPPEPEPQ